MKPEKKVVKNNVGTYIYIVLNPEIFRYIDGQLLPNNTGNINKYTESPEPPEAPKAPERLKTTNPT